MRVDRRRFLGQAIGFGAAALAGQRTYTLSGQTPPAKPTNVRVGTKAVLGPADFTYLGAFAVPSTYSIDGADQAYAEGLTHRYRGDQLELFCALWKVGGGNPVVAMRPPVLSSGPTYSPAEFTYWGDIYGGKNFDRVTGLFWDEVDRRLYWNCVNAYNTLSSYVSFGYSVLNDASRVASAYGPYSFPIPPNYKPIKGMCPLPTSVAARLGGKRVGAGFGGYESIMAAGSASMGPTLVAFDPTALASVPEGGTLPASATQVLLNHPYNGTPYSSPLRARRSPDYAQAFDGWHPRDGVGYWTWTDTLRQGACWIETANRAGFLVLARLAGGGETAQIIGVSPNPTYGAHGYSLTLSAPLANTRIDESIQCALAGSGPGTTGLAIVKAVSGSTIGVDLLPSGYFPNPVPLVGGSVLRGAWYYNSTLRCTTGYVKAFVYDPEELLAGKAPDAVDWHGSWPWPIPTLPNPLPSWSDEGPGIVTGITFDPLASRLYVLVRAAWPFGDRFPNAMVFVYGVA